MNYKLTVIRYESNPKYSPCSDPYYKRQEEPEFLTNETALTVTLKEEEFIAIKKAVIEVIKWEENQKNETL